MSTSDISTAELYLQAKDVIVSLVTEENQHTLIPACPEWTLRDLLGHQAGEIEDARLDNLDDLGQPHWTAAQVNRHSYLDLEGVKRAWDEQIRACGAAFPQIAHASIPDIAVHEFDVRGAVGDTGRRDSEVVAAAFDRLTSSAHAKFRQMGLPALRIIAGDKSVVLGDGDPEGELVTTAFEVTRFLTGRRSLSQMATMQWSGNSARWMHHLSFMPPRLSDLVE